MAANPLPARLTGPIRRNRFSNRRMGSADISCHRPGRFLYAQIRAVRFTSGIPVAYQRAQIFGNNWSRGWNVNDGAGSRRPGVYLINGRGFDTVDLDIRVTGSQNVNGPALITGQLGPVTIQGWCPVTVGNHSVNAQIVNRPNAIAWYWGDAAWTMHAQNFRAIPIGSTRLEVFFILDTPANMYLPNGVWVEALRLLCANGLVGVTHKLIAAVRTTLFCHSHHGMLYDAIHGASSCNVHSSGGTFALMDYINGVNPVVNCFDQAAAVQSLAGALGVWLEWLFMQPFGYINITNLVGRGACNNPFFMGNGTLPIVAVLDPHRTSFSNHAFCRFRPLLNPDLPLPAIAPNAGIHGILDACAGPALGVHNTQNYATASIDYTGALYPPTPGRFTIPGFWFSAVHRVGVQNLF